MSLYTFQGPAEYVAPMAARGRLEPLEAMAPFMGVFFVAFFVAIAVTPLVRKLAIKNGIIDWPDLKRKNHKLPVAYLGGVAIFVAWLAGIFSSYLISPDHVATGSYALRVGGFPLSILLGAGVITLTGLFDDIYGIRARVKIGGQLFAAAALTWQHVGTDLTYSLFGLVGLSPSTEVVYFAATFLVALFVLGGCNAVNLIDGLDGLASGVVAISMAGFLAITLLAGGLITSDAGLQQFLLQNPVRITLALATIGAILGFLPYNFNPARIFMGDAGSLLLGFLSVSAILLFGDSGTYSFKLVTASLVVFAVPITDTSLAIIRRKMRGQPIFAPDNQHLHHLLRRSGMTVRKSVITLYFVAVIFATIGVCMIAFDLRWRYSLAIFFVIYGFIMVTAFKYGAYCLAMDRLRQQEQADPIPSAAPINQAEPKPDTNDDSALDLDATDFPTATQRA